MKRVCCFIMGLLCCCTVWAQRTVKMRNLWVEPKVHIYFNRYKLSFAAKDVRKAVKLLQDDSVSVDPEMVPDTVHTYKAELYAGHFHQYNKPIEPLMQQYIGAYLLSIGKAEVRNPKGKLMTEIILDVLYPERRDELILVNCYDPKTNEMLFQGVLPETLLARDIGIDD